MHLILGIAESRVELAPRTKVVEQFRYSVAINIIISVIARRSRARDRQTNRRTTDGVRL